MDRRAARDTINQKVNVESLGYGVPIVVEQEATILLIAPGKVLKRQEFEEHRKGANKFDGMTADTGYAICSSASKSLIEKEKGYRLTDDRSLAQK